MGTRLNEIRKFKIKILSTSTNNEYNHAGSTDDNSVKQEYDGFTAKHRGLRIHELWDYIHDRRANGCVQFYKEFGHLKPGPIHVFGSANKEENKFKNRYKGFCAYDHCRVTLDVEEGQSDYINASFINGFGKIDKFIATQGPTKSTTDEFWLMIWQQVSTQIVMLTPLVERGTEKCFQYWPDTGAVKHGLMNIMLISTATTTQFTVRQFEIWMTGLTRRRVTQYHFEAWPDKDIPDSTWPLVVLWRSVMKDYNARRGRTGPMVVHCSAGVGRTGTFIALDNLYQQSQIEGCIAPLNIVDLLRDQRVSMVQTKEQYVYLHDVLADVLLMGTCDIHAKHLPEIYDFLQKNDDGTESRTHLQLQHKLILSSKKPELFENSALATIQEEPEYSNMSSFNKGVVADERDTSKTLQTVHLPYHSGNSGFILVDHPTKETSDKLWTLVTDRHIKTIITLSGPAGEKSNFQTVLEVHNSNVEIVEEQVTEEYMVETFRIPINKNTQESSASFDLTFLEFRIWNEVTDLPVNTSGMLHCIQAARERQHQLSDNQPVLFICRDNIASAGLVCTLLCEIDRCSQLGPKLNIIQTVKRMRESHSDILNSLDHFKFVYECLTEFVQQESIYQNV